MMASTLRERTIIVNITEEEPDPSFERSLHLRWFVAGIVNLALADGLALNNPAPETCSMGKWIIICFEYHGCAWRRFGA